MRAVSRVTIVWLTAAVALAPAVALAQQTTPTSNSTSPNTIGPPQLQNFSLPGTVTRPSDQPATTAPATPPQTAPSSPPPTARATERRPQATARAPRNAPVAERPSVAATRQSTELPVAATPTVSEPAPSPAPPPTAQSNFAPAAPSSQPVPTSPAIPTFAWLLAALLLGAGGAFLFFRNRARHAFAAGGHDSFDEPSFERAAAPVAPAPSPPAALRPAPVQGAAPPAPPATPPSPAADVVAPKPVGIVSTRLRPWLDIGFNPIRCVLDQERATIDFEVELANSGGAPARGIIVAATAFNAGPSQDALISAFFEQPDRQGHAVDAIGPLGTTVVPLQLIIPRDQLQPYELGGQQVFVPLLAVTATYAWGSSEGQTSASYLLGRATSGEKLGPFRIDAAPRIFRGLGARTLPVGVRR